MTTKISKKMSYILRHNPASAGLVLDSGGWVGVDLLTRALGIEQELLMEVVQADSKSRFMVKEGKIRANQGHSIAVDLELADQAPPEFLFHGTVDRSLESIFSQGLLPQERHAVHLSSSRFSALEVGARRGEAAILVIKAGEMSRQGYSFQVSANDVWLTEAVPAPFIRV